MRVLMTVAFFTASALAQVAGRTADGRVRTRSGRRVSFDKKLTKRMFDLIDHNHDSLIDKQELVEDMMFIYDEGDDEHEELLNAAEDEAADFFKVHDRNGDGKLNPSEYMSSKLHDEL